MPKVEQDLLSLMEDSMDGGPPSVGSGELPVASPLPASTPLTKAQKDQLQKVGMSSFTLKYCLNFCSQSQREKTRKRGKLSPAIFSIRERFAKTSRCRIPTRRSAKFPAWLATRWVLLSFLLANFLFLSSFVVAATHC